MQGQKHTLYLTAGGIKVSDFKWSYNGSNLGFRGQISFSGNSCFWKMSDGLVRPGLEDGEDSPDKVFSPDSAIDEDMRSWIVWYMKEHGSAGLP